MPPARTSLEQHRVSKWMKLVGRVLEMGAVALLLHFCHPRLTESLNTHTLHSPGPTPDQLALNC